MARITGTRSFARPFLRAFKSAVVAGAFGSVAALRVVTRARPISAGKLDTRSELAIALAGAFAAVGLLRLVEWMHRRFRPR